MSACGARAKFVFAGIGTKGDSFPLLALGQEMLRRGHAVHLLSNDGLGSLAARHGVDYTPVTIELTNNLGKLEDNMNCHVFPSYEPTFAFFREQVRCAERLVVVNLDEHSASNLMCERYGLPLCRIDLAPWKIRSLIRPPFPFNQPLTGRLAKTFVKYRLPHLYEGLAHSKPFVAALNPYRQRLGLPPITTARSLDALITQRMGFFPSWYAEPAPDWPARYELTGFPLPRSTSRLPAELVAFLDLEGKPLVFTPGSGVTDVQDFFHDARRCCDALGMPGIFLSPHLRKPAGGFGPRILHFDFLDLELVLKSAAALVHHGGIGTTARALQAGVPQVIRPVAYDQFDNGDRVTSLGVGRFLVPEAYSCQRLIESLRQLTSSLDVKRNLNRFEQQIAGSDALAVAATVLERTLAGGERQHEAMRRAI